MLGYVLAVAQRTTLGVAGLDAADRFAIDPGTLSAFVFIQVAVYIAAQIPAGLLVDRFGSRIMLVASGVLLAAGQLLLAVTTALPLAVLARVLVGAGDAIVFSAVFSLVPRWFPARRVPVLAQLTGMLCQFGQVLSAVPFAALLHAAGWSTAFGVAAAVSALGAGLAFAVVRNAPAGRWSPAPSVSAARDRPAAARGVAAAGHPAGLLRPHGHPVLDDGVHAAVGRAVPADRAAALARRGRRAAHPVRDLHDRHRPDAGRAGHPAPAAPVLAGARR